ncbi:unnamed protein product [Lymnaea stagnalis]|uniref:Mitochondrial fission regulator 2 n=1 Tax=Lymnaea stagnalis TaxID=6523 RepID=A0AAV2HL76_LYMST
MTDVIEDLENFLRRAIDCLNHILTGLRHRINQNGHRPLNHKTLVRWISAFLPAPRDPRLRLQSELGPQSSKLSRWGSYGSLHSVGSFTSINGIVQEDLGENLVRFRLGCTDEDSDIFDDPHFAIFNQDHLTSTPNFNTSICSSRESNELAASNKLVEMEEELAVLRKQIAMLVMQQELSSMDHTDEVKPVCRSVSQVAAIPLPKSPDSSSSLEDSGCESENFPTVVTPCSSSDDGVQSADSPHLSGHQQIFIFAVISEDFNTTNNLLDTNAIAPDFIFQKSSAPCTDNSEIKGKISTSASFPDMAHVLKDLTNVKLKAVQRSPGGTPMRRKPLSAATDPASIIAQALKKKFARHRGNSPDSDLEHDSSGSFRFEHCSPGCGPFNKQTKRRLSIHEDLSDNWSPVSSPMKPQ